MATKTTNDPWGRLSQEMLLPVGMTFVVSGGREGWLQRCHDVLEAAPHFSDVRVEEGAFEVSARFHRIPLRGTLTVTLVSEGDNATRMNATATMMALPNFFTLLGTPQRRILERFRRAVGQDERENNGDRVQPLARTGSSVEPDESEGVVDRGRPLARISWPAMLLVLTVISVAMVVSWLINGTGSAYYLLSVPALWALVFVLRVGRGGR
jgi:hypothetical protein